MKLAVAFLLLGACVFAAYYNALDNEFVFDDFSIVLDYGPVTLAPQDWPKIFGLAGGEAQYRPLRTLSYAVDFQLGGLDPFVFHLSNLVYHWLASFLAFLAASEVTGGLGRQAAGTSPGQRRTVALFASVLWALHPIQTDSVTYVSGRRDILAGLFFFLGLYAFLRWRASAGAGQRLRRAAWGTLAFSAYALGVASKEVAVVLPVMFLVYDLCRARSAEHGVWQDVKGFLRKERALYGCLFGAAVLALVYYLSYVAPILRWHGGGPLATGQPLLDPARTDHWGLTTGDWRLAARPYFSQASIRAAVRRL